MRRSHPKNPWINNGLAARALIFCTRHHLPVLSRLFMYFLGCDIGLALPKRVFLPHPLGIVIHCGTRIGDDVVIGRGALVENDTTIGELTKIQADAYITAYSTLEDHVFIAPRVITTNDNFMGRTEKRHALRKGPTIRRGARVGAGAVLCPKVEIGEEAFVGAGAVVVKDVPPGVLVVGNPARALRDVPPEELL